MIFESIPVQNTVSEELKCDIFLILHFSRQVNGGTASPVPWLRYRLEKFDSVACVRR